MYAFFDLEGIRRRGEIVQMNHKTVQVQVMIGASSFAIIKRHIQKHNVTIHKA